MKKTPESFLQQLRHVTLSTDEAQSMRERLSAYADLHSVMKGAPSAVTPSPFQLFIFSRTFVASTLALVLLVSSTGISYAANQTLPGQPLYVVKVAINEPLQGALLTTPTAKAKWSNTLADRRLSEASVLAAHGTLATSAQSYLAEAVIRHVADSQQQSKTLTVSGNTDEALKVQSDLEARLSAHAQLLAILAPGLESVGDTTTKEAVVALLDTVNTQHVAVQSSREASEVALAGPQPLSSMNTMTTATLNTQDPSPLSPTTEVRSAAAAFVQTVSANRQSEEVSLLNRDASAVGLPIQGTSVSTETVTTSEVITATSTSPVVQTGSAIHATTTQLKIGKMPMTATTTLTRTSTTSSELGNWLISNHHKPSLLHSLLGGT